MLIPSLILLIAATGILVILLRRLPEVKRGFDRNQPSSERPPDALLPKRGSSPGRMAKLPSDLSQIVRLNWRWRAPSTGRFGPNARQESLSSRDDLAQNLLADAQKLFERGDMKAAERLFLEAATQDRKNPTIYNRLGIIYLKQANYRDARDAFLTALRFDDRLASRHFNLGMAFLGLGNTNKALVSIKKALELDPVNPKYSHSVKRLSKA